MLAKTSTKDAIYAVLAANGNHVRKSEKSFNSMIGKPLTILGVGNAWKDPLGWLSNIMRGLELVLFKVDYPDILVLEIGADHPGDIENLQMDASGRGCYHKNRRRAGACRIFRFTGSCTPREALFGARGPAWRAGKEGGTVMLYADDEKLKDLKFEGRKIMTYGMDESALVKGSSPTILYKEENGSRKPSGISFKLEYAGSSVPVSLLGVLGIQHVYPVLAAVAVGLVQGLPLVKIVQGLPCTNLHAAV